jgi:putative nucleotidyltransferase with HDIG domain
MAFYTIQKGSNAERQQVKEWLLGLDRLSSDSQEKIITAWISSWKSSNHMSMDNIPGFSFSAYKLTDHVNDVVHFGISMAEEAIKRWGLTFDWEELIEILILHDIDKPLLMDMNGDKIEKSKWASQIQHGVLGALLLQEIGFSEKVIGTVATHATNSPFHGSSTEAYILHYADMFAADHAVINDGLTPYYQRLSLKK